MTDREVYVLGKNEFSPEIETSLSQFSYAQAWVCNLRRVSGIYEAAAHQKFAVYPFERIWFAKPKKYR